MADIIYFGDGDLNGAARYLAGIMDYSGLGFDYCPSDTPASSIMENKEARVYIISDYPSRNFASKELEQIRKSVENGDSSLLMIGGWKSFHGQNGLYDKTRLTAVLPVKMMGKDDRLNSYKPLAVEPIGYHKIIRGLDLSRVPVVGGLNIVSKKEDYNCELVLQVRELNILKGETDYTLEWGNKYPLLTVGTYGKGKTAAFMSNVAPPWIGPMVYWGTRQVVAGGENSREIEVGDCYVEFFSNLVNWCLD